MVETIIRRAATQPQTGGRGRTDTFYIYGAIGWDLFGEGITAADLVPQIRASDAAALEVRINSIGGDVFEGLTIFNAIASLRTKGIRTTAYIDGMAYSIAGVIAMGADTVVMAANASFMIHDPAAVLYATADELRKVADQLDETTISLVDAYQRHTNAGRDRIAAWMDDETWFTAAEAAAAGFVEQVDEPLPIAACLPSAVRFRNVPQWVQKQQTKAARPNYERFAAAVRSRQKEYMQKARERMVS